MGQEYLIDTNVIIDFFTSKFSGKNQKFVADIIDNNICISIISQIELLSLPNVNPVIENFVEECYIFELNSVIVNKTIEIHRKKKIKIPDAIIAATAVVHNRILITANTQDFDNIKGLKILNAHTIL